MINTTSKLNDLFKPGQPLPPDNVMIATGLNILNYSPHGQQLVQFAKDNQISFQIISLPHPTVYLPEPHKAYIGFNRGNPITPSRFVLMQASILRESMQEFAGIRHPSLSAPLEEHKKISLAKHEDIIWYICTIAYELSNQDMFSEYNFLDELRKMGHDESLALFLKQQGK